MNNGQSVVPTVGGDGGGRLDDTDPHTALLRSLIGEDAPNQFKAQTFFTGNGINGANGNVPMLHPEFFAAMSGRPPAVPGYMMNPSNVGYHGTHGQPLFFNAPYFGMNMVGDGNHLHHNLNNANFENHYAPIISNQPPFSFDMQSMLGINGMMQHSLPPYAIPLPTAAPHQLGNNPPNYANDKNRSLKKVGKAPSAQASKGGRKRSGSTVSDTIQRRESNSDGEGDERDEPGSKRLTRNQREQKR